MPTNPLEAHFNKLDRRLGAEGVAVVHEVGVPVRVLKHVKPGVVLGRLLRRTFPDRIGALAPRGRMTAVELKDTDNPDGFCHKLVKKHQRAYLLAVERMGAFALVIVRCGAPGPYFGTLYGVRPGWLTPASTWAWEDMQTMRLPDEGWLPLTREF